MIIAMHLNAVEPGSGTRQFAQNHKPEHKAKFRQANAAQTRGGLP